MKVKWREYELLLAGLIGILTIISYGLYFKNLSSSDIDSIYADPYRIHEKIFNYWTNIFLPQIGSIVLILGGYYWINFKTLPVLLNTSKVTRIKAYILIAGQIFLVSYVLSIGINLLSFYVNSRYWNYGLFNVFDYFSFNKEVINETSSSLLKAFIYIAIYTAYGVLRDTVISKINTSITPRTYLISIMNRVCLIVLLCISVPVFLRSIQIDRFNDYYTIYLTFIIPNIFLYVVTTYWLFPLRASIISSLLIIGVLILFTFIFTALSFGALTNVGFHRDWWLLSWIIQLFVAAPISWLLYQLFNDKILKLKAAEDALLKTKTDLQFLRSQINPHFLFNTLNTLYGLALREEASYTAASIQKLGDMMRFMLQDNTLDFIPIKHEFDYLNNYISLQSLRLNQSDKLIIETEINDHGFNHQVVPMLFIPFIENAFKYGISLKEKSWIKMQLKCSEQNIEFNIRNTIHLNKVKDLTITQTGIGIENVRERLLLYYRDRFELNYGITGEEYIVRLIIQPDKHNSSKKM